MPSYILKLDTSGTIDGSQLGALARVADAYEYEDIREMNFDYLAENVKSAFDDIDHEAALLDALNAYGQQIMDDQTRDAVANLGIADLLPNYERSNSGLLLGAWLALRHADAFPNHLADWTEARRNELREVLGDYSHMPEPYAAELQKAVDSSEEYAFDEYLHGDRSNPGILGRGIATEKIFGRLSHAQFDWQKFPDDIVTLDIEAEDLFDWLEDNSGSHSAALEAWLDTNIPEYKESGDIPSDFRTLPPDDLVAAGLSDELNYLIRKNNDKRKTENEIRRAEREKANAYRAEREAKENAARIAKLESMKKPNA